jgi:uncharacterized membrane protein YeaQ/YmgE (transglycosylase-associated protein family)
MSELIAIVVVGLLAGIVASLRVRAGNGEERAVVIVTGVVGALIGGTLLAPLVRFLANFQEPAPGGVGLLGVGIALVGAIAIPALAGALSRRPIDES